MRARCMHWAAAALLRLLVPGKLTPATQRKTHTNHTHNTHTQTHSRQGIYYFRGSDPSNLTAAHDCFVGIETKYLQDNYRCVCVCV